MKKQRFLPCFGILSSFLSEAHYVLISTKYRSIFIIATKKKTTTENQ